MMNKSMVTFHKIKTNERIAFQKDLRFIQVSEFESGDIRWQSNVECPAKPHIRSPNIIIWLVNQGCVSQKHRKLELIVATLVSMGLVCT